ncbi:VrrA/YqfQ family protein [Priestia taiwanensis]|uniref:YqfQ-like protein n=1 Tax=Priestia taiwanensis TaxID=1347902 RepID=A0A917AVV6_9BACI|nr:VrrA/YqfQ family protein [Priestia taiwanensis]MBM7363768.1 hypothetical protein [Priestia taiwanensis]GGE74323.1 hypothetical protein GCM10007140_25180 [Priestia taiwanensis]
MLFQKHPTPNHHPFSSPQSSMMGQRPPAPSPHYQQPPFQQLHPMNQQPFPTPDMMRMHQSRGMNQSSMGTHQQGMQQKKGIGNLFSNLFSRARGPNFSKTAPHTQTRVAGAASAAASTTQTGVSGMFSKMFSNINGSAISTTLGNVQKVTQMAGNVIPTVQQFGPMVKNLPSLLKIFKEVNTDDTTSTETPSSPPTTETVSAIKQNKKEAVPSNTEQKKNSAPKMYI